MVVNRDVTERRALENQFRQAQKMEAGGRLSGGIAHDFNNILGVIIGYSEILLERTAKSDERYGYSEEILTSAGRAASLTRQLLAFSRQQVLELRVLDLNTVIADTEKMLRRLIGEDIELCTTLEPNLPWVKADQGQIEQVILNLAVNARDAMPSGGKLALRTENVVLTRDAHRDSYVVAAGRYVLLSVKDSGTGMPPAIQAQIFEPFFTTKEKGKGTGLGLATVYGVVKQSGGYIEVESEIGLGAEFKIYLPQAEGPLEPEVSQGARIELPGGQETILLVEDESALRTMTRSILQNFGYTVLEANDGAQAAAISAQYDGVIHLMLTDVIMPGINGRDLAVQVSAARPAIKIVYMSGYTGQVPGHGVLPAGSHFLPKPFTRESLVHKLREALNIGPASLDMRSTPGSTSTLPQGAHL